MGSHDGQQEHQIEIDGEPVFPAAPFRPFLEDVRRLVCGKAHRSANIHPHCRIADAKSGFHQITSTANETTA